MAQTKSHSDAFVMPPFLPAFQPGTVWLVGVGPGDPGLLTLLAWQALNAADVIVYDALVDSRVLDMVRPGAQIVYAGKRGGRPSHDQRDISLRLVELARDGHRVARLKGGDPYVFGRGGEEARTLAQHGIDFRIVPGITAGIGGLAYAGIPLTHRDTNASVAFVTGHGSDGNTPPVDWTALAQGAQALVIYMPLGHLTEISERLLAAGRPADEPVALVSRASMPEQTVITADLGSVVGVAAAQSVTPPTILVVGGIVDFAEDLSWFAKRQDVRGSSAAVAEDESP